MTPWSGSHDKRYSTAKWRKARERALLAAQYRCEIRGPGCLGHATEVDHIRGLNADPEHRYLQAVCKPCHATRTAAQSGRRQPPDDPDPKPWPM